MSSFFTGSQAPSDIHQSDYVLAFFIHIFYTLKLILTVVKSVILIFPVVVDDA